MPHDPEKYLYDMLEASRFLLERLASKRSYPNPNRGLIFGSFVY
jgi:hypothetical protein